MSGHEGLYASTGQKPTKLRDPRPHVRVRTAQVPRPLRLMARTTPRMRKTQRRPRPGASAYPKAKKLSLSIIGAGRLGTALAIALTRAGHSIELIVAKRLTSARRAVRLSGGQAVAAPVEEFRRMPAHEPVIPNDLIIIATPDDAISSVADDLAQIMKR